MRRLFFYHAEQIEKIGKICYNIRNLKIIIIHHFYIIGERVYD